MKRAIAMKWAKALESGEYSQRRGRLKYTSSDGTTCHCVLGVLCEIAVKEGVIEEKTEERSGLSKAYLFYDGGLHYNVRLPPSVIRWAGISPFISPILNTKDIRNYIEGYYNTGNQNISITTLNDVYLVPFKVFAKLIRKQYKDM